MTITKKNIPNKKEEKGSDSGWKIIMKNLLNYKTSKSRI